MQFVTTARPGSRVDEASLRAQRVAAKVAFAEQARRKAERIVERADRHGDEAYAAQRYAVQAAARLEGLSRRQYSS